MTALDLLSIIATAIFLFVFLPGVVIYGTKRWRRAAAELQEVHAETTIRHRAKQRDFERNEEIKDAQHRQKMAREKALAAQAESFSEAVEHRVKALPPGDLASAADAVREIETAVRTFPQNGAYEKAVRP